MTRLIIEGWRFLPHSYSIVNQLQCLEILKYPSIQLFHQDVPYFGQSWQPVSNLFDNFAELALKSIPSPSLEQGADVVFRISYPYNFNSSTAKQTCVFGTSEYCVVYNEMLLANSPLQEAHNNSDITIITPSQWSKDGFIRSGADPKRVVVVPHGVDVNIFKPLAPAERAALRKELGWEGFIFLNIGGMTQNKGIALLLNAFAGIVDAYPDAKLVLKGIDSLYPSEDFLVQCVEELTFEQAEKVLPKLTYIGKTLSFYEMARLYQAADAYVCPYYAEGFNIPALEAIACGLPLICTKGGPTDDFIQPDFALSIESKLQPVTIKNLFSSLFLIPEIEHLIQLMKIVIENKEFITQARYSGPNFISSNFTWKHVTAQLLDALMPS